MENQKPKSSNLPKIILFSVLGMAVVGVAVWAFAFNKGGNLTGNLSFNMRSPGFQMTVPVQDVAQPAPQDQFVQTPQAMNPAVNSEIIANSDLNISPAIIRQAQSTPTHDYTIPNDQVGHTSPAGDVYQGLKHMPALSIYIDSYYSPSALYHSGDQKRPLAVLKLFAGSFDVTLHNLTLQGYIDSNTIGKFSRNGVADNLTYGDSADSILSNEVDNLALYDDERGVQVSKLESISPSGKLFFKNLDYKVPKTQVRYLTLMGNVNVNAPYGLYFNDRIKFAVVPPSDFVGKPPADTTVAIYYGDLPPPRPDPCYRPHCDPSLYISQDAYDSTIINSIVDSTEFDVREALNYGDDDDGVIMTISR